MAVVTIEQVRAHLNLGTEDEPDTSHDSELEDLIEEVEEYISSRRVMLQPTEFTEDAAFDNGLILTRYWPILTVVSLEDDYGSSYTTDFTIGDDAFSIKHGSVGSGVYRVTYTAGFDGVPASLRTAVKEDIRGIYQPGQIGPAAEFGAFGVDSTDTGTTYRPVRMWPRVDAWITFRFGS